MSAGAVRVVDVVHAREGSTLTIEVDSVTRDIALGGLGAVVVERAISALGAAVEAGATLDEAIDRLPHGDVPRRTQRLDGIAGTLLLDDTDAVSPGDVRASLRVLADLGRSGLRTIAVVGPLQVEERDRLDEHDALGRIVVRLDIAQLVVVGHDARHLFMAASLEGSWDGESVLFDDAATAYDFVRATTGPNTVILVSSGAHGALAELVARLQEAPR